jgi:site-specific recombinase XerD
MKYIYKHGNQYWYQRAIPGKLTKILGKKTIKISLRTNKISTALIRAKLQSAEHKKMFTNLINKKFTINFLKKVDISKFNLSFKDDSDDLFSKMLLNKKQITNLATKKSEQSIENFLFNNVISNNNFLSKLLEKYLKLKKIDPKATQYSSIANSIKYLIKICGDKPIDEFSSIDSKKFQNFFILEKRISTGKRYQSNLFNFFKTLYDYSNIDKKNPFENIKWPTTYFKPSIEPLNINEIKKIISITKEEKSLFSMIIGCILNTGVSINELISINRNEINLNQFNPYILIRSNDIRKINNIYKKRIIPLVGVSYESMDKLLRLSTNEYPFYNFLGSNFTIKKIESKINFRIKKITDNKSLQSFKISLIERLKKINCPEEIISEILGLKKRSIFYKNEISIEMKFSWLNQIIE